MHYIQLIFCKIPASIYSGRKCWVSGLQEIQDSLFNQYRSRVEMLGQWVSCRKYTYRTVCTVYNQYRSRVEMLGQWVAGNTGQSVQLYNQYRSRVEMLGQWVAGNTGQSVQCTTNTGPAWRCWVSGLQEIQGSLYNQYRSRVEMLGQWVAGNTGQSVQCTTNTGPAWRCWVSGLQEIQDSLYSVQLQYRSRVEMLGQWVAGNTGQSVQCTTNTGPAWRCWVSGLQEIQDSLYSVQLQYRSRVEMLGQWVAGNTGQSDSLYNQYRSRVEMLGQWVAGNTGQSVQCTTNTGPAWRCWVSGLQEIQDSLYSVQPIPVPRGDAGSVGCREYRTVCTVYNQYRSRVEMLGQWVAGNTGQSVQCTTNTGPAWRCWVSGLQEIQDSLYSVQPIPVPRGDAGSVGCRTTYSVQPIPVPRGDAGSVGCRDYRAVCTVYNQYRSRVEMLGQWVAGNTGQSVQCTTNTGPAWRCWVSGLQEIQDSLYSVQPIPVPRGDAGSVGCRDYRTVCTVYNQYYRSRVEMLGQWVAGNTGQSVQCTTNTGPAWRCWVSGLQEIQGSLYSVQPIPVPRGDAGSVGCRKYRTVCTVYNQYRSRVEMLGQWVAGNTGQSVQCTTNTGPAVRVGSVSQLQEIQDSLYSVQPIPVPRGDAGSVGCRKYRAVCTVYNQYRSRVEMLGQWVAGNTGQSVQCTTNTGPAWRCWVSEVNSAGLM